MTEKIGIESTAYIGISIQYNSKAVPKNLERECDKALWTLKKIFKSRCVEFKWPLVIGLPLCECKRIISCVEDLATCQCKHGDYFVKIEEI